ncbi:MAG TPA: M56 family metallopeptidase, partial [Candidatus Binatia bacterium]|nr:M56 family metallopeptidase [Candidatus Binatia bacterium]
MKTYPGLGGCINWLLAHSFQAGVLVLLVLAVQWAFRRRLTNRWRFALWWIVLARLLLPFSPQSALSLFNYLQPVAHLGEPRSTPPAPEAIAQSGTSESESANAPSPNVVSPPKIQTSPHDSPRLSGAPADTFQTISTDSTPEATAPARPFALKDYWAPLLAGLWLTGILGLTGFVIAQLLRFRRKLAGATAPADSRLQTLLDV